jgi:hypothetical protein
LGACEEVEQFESQLVGACDEECSRALYQMGRICDLCGTGDTILQRGTFLTHLSSLSMPEYVDTMSKSGLRLTVLLTIDQVSQNLKLKLTQSMKTLWSTPTAIEGNSKANMKPHKSDLICKRNCGANTETKEHVRDKDAETGEDSAVSETLDESLPFLVTEKRNNRSNDSNRMAGKKDGAKLQKVTNAARQMQETKEKLGSNK